VANRVGGGDGGDLPNYQKGTPILAKDLNKIIALLINRITGIQPILCQPTAGGLLISYTGNPIIGSPGSTTTPYAVMANLGAGKYTLQQYTLPGGGGTTVGDPITASEFSGSTQVPSNASPLLYVPGWQMSDGNVWFWAPYGC
jgi:hypothetical protein